MASAEKDLGDYLPAELTKTLAAYGIEGDATDTPSEITFLCAEVAGFAGLTEDVAKLLFETLSSEIEAQSGTTEQLGNVLIGHWGAPAPDPNHALNACRAALACQGAVRAAGLTHNGGSPLRLRMGINSQRMLIGNLETEARLDYEFMRDAAHVAARLTSANQQYGTEVIIGDETRQLTGSHVHIRELDRVIVGKQPVELAIYELLAIAREGESTPSWVTLYDMGLADFRTQNLESAIGFFQMLLTVREGDRAAQYMIDRCRSLLDSSPAPSPGR
jgi:adenylate cyclase